MRASSSTTRILSVRAAAWVMVLRNPICNSDDSAQRGKRIPRFRPFNFTVLQMLPQGGRLHTVRVLPTTVGPVDLRTNHNRRNPIPMKCKAMLAACALLAGAAGLCAQTLPPPQNVLQLQATGTVEVQQDLLTM